MADKELALLEALIDASHNAPELCLSCKYLERDVFNDVAEKWCGLTANQVIRVWLCTMYEQMVEIE